MKENSQSTNEKETAPENPLRILIVEDSPTQALRLKVLLEEQGYDITVAANGAEGLAALESRYHPVVISDWVMPELDGIEFCKRIRGRENPGYIYIVLVTAKGEKTDLISGIEAGADDYLVKPFDIGELIARLKTAERIISLEQNLIRARKKIEKLTVTDPLTGAYNRRHLTGKLPDAVRYARRYGRHLSLVMCDIDHFKQVNDRHGHQAGDAVLAEFADRLIRTVRKGADWLARYGGEEFVIVLPETDACRAYQAAERYRRLIAEEPFETGAATLQVTASLGTATLSPDNATQASAAADALIETADRHLYAAKRKGRNRTEPVPGREKSGIALVEPGSAAP
jgi:diguanylate cyclase (GGDEF)-like protein